MHQREAFTDYTPMGNSSVTGVSRKEALIMGHRAVELKSTCNGAKYILHLENVLHVPGMQNNLILLDDGMQLVDATIAEMEKLHSSQKMEHH